MKVFANSVQKSGTHLLLQLLALLGVPRYPRWRLDPEWTRERSVGKRLLMRPPGVGRPIPIGQGVDASSWWIERLAAAMPEPSSLLGHASWSPELAALVTGTWRLSTGGSCQSAYFRSAERVKTSRNEEAVAGTVTSQGMTVTGQLIIAGPREGQFINPATDRAVFLMDTLPNNQLGFAPIGEPVLSWPEVKLDRCTG